MIKLIPAYKDYLWGGTQLRTLYGKDCDLEIVAESWELSTHPNGESIVANGEFEGKVLSEYIKAHGKKVLGTRCPVENDLPILIKFIDAKQSLSIQVHPDDEYSQKYEGDFGKTEMWYIVEAEPGAKLVYGFNKDLTQEEFRTHIENNTLTEVMNYVPVQKGDAFFIEAGTLHAIGEGIIIAEIQQRSDVTYRVYDFGRLGVDGQPRELHVEKSLEVTKLEKATSDKVNYVWEDCQNGKIAELANCKYFHVDALELNGEVVRNVGEESFEAVMVLEGSIEVIGNEEKFVINKGETIFVPANYGKYSLVGNGQVVLSTI